MAKFRMEVTVTTNFAFEVEADSTQDAFDKGVDMWCDAPTTGQWELPGEETDYRIRRIELASA